VGGFAVMKAIREEDGRERKDIGVGDSFVCANRG